MTEGAQDPEQESTEHTHLPAPRSGSEVAVQRRAARTARQLLRELGRLMVRGRPPRGRCGWPVRTAVPPVPAAAWPGGGRLGSEPAARSLALNW